MRERLLIGIWIALISSVVIYNHLKLSDLQQSVSEIKGSDTDAVIEVIPGNQPNKYQAVINL